jgi:uncharacterized protein
MISPRLTRWQLPIFFLLAFAITWSAQIPAYTYAHLLTFGVVGWTIVLTWIYNNTQSVFWIIVIHGWSNTVQSYLVLSSGSLIAQGLYGFLPWVVAIFLLRRYESQTLTGRKGDQPARLDTG